MISGMFDQFLFKQILSLIFEVIQWLGNALDISISFVHFFTAWIFLMRKRMNDGLLRDVI